jgi:hypothetical protein
MAAGFLYQNYCYPVLSDAVNAFMSNSFFVSGTATYSAASYAIIATNPNAVKMTFSTVPFTTTTVSTYVNQVNFPTCPTVGALASSTTDFITGLTTTLNTFFLFDAPLFDAVIGQVLAVMAVGVSTGLIVKLLKR